MCIVLLVIFSSLLNIRELAREKKLDAATNLRTNNYKNELYIFKYPGTGQGEPWNLIIVFVQKMEASRNLKIRR